MPIACELHHAFDESLGQRSVHSTQVAVDVTSMSEIFVAGCITDVWAQKSLCIEDFIKTSITVDDRLDVCMFLESPLKFSKGGADAGYIRGFFQNLFEPAEQ